MKIEKIALGHIAANCYLLTSDNAAVVIDPGTKNEKVLNFLFGNADKERLILLTHAHFDHIGGAQWLREQTGTKIAIGKNEAFALADTEVNLSARFHAHIEPFEADILLNDDEKFTVGDIEFLTLETPGHTVGGACYHTGNTLFSGDILFKGTIGRTDFPGGNIEDMKKSLAKLGKLADDTVVLPGHEESTTIFEERKCNPFVRDV